MYDVIVIGAGPTGCYAARELARRSYEVLVLEEHTEIGEPVHCTGILGTEACERFDLDPASIETYLSSARFVSPSGQSFRVAADEAKAVVVDRSRFDRILGEQALSAGASFLLGSRVESVSPYDDGAVVRASAFGERGSHRASLVIVATGADDSITERLGLASPSGPAVFGAQLITQLQGLDEVEVHVGRRLAPGGFAWAVPANGHGCRVGLVSRRQPQPLLRRFVRSLERRGAIRSNGAGMRCRAVPSGPRLPSFGERVLVVGDAAGQVKSTTSGGIYYGLLGTEVAVATAEGALQNGDFAAAALAEYEARWLDRLGREQRTGRVLRSIRNALTDGEIEAFFWMARRTGIPRLLSQLHFDWHTSGLLSLLWKEWPAALAPARGRRPVAPR
jgi:geranylgeranyl reductase family protein